MRQRALSLLFGATISLIAGCATPVTLGRTALRQGQYAEAAKYFREVLTHDPDRREARLGLGISQYKLGDLDAAVDVLEPLVAQAPDHHLGRLYLGLSYLRKSEDGQADEAFTALRDLRPFPRLAVQLDRAASLLRGDPLSADMREFIATSLEHEVESAQEIRELRSALDAYRTRAFHPGRSIILVPRRHRR